ncbi:MAG TPA: 6-carboxytetrahydropterin synthase [bacterium]|nr:6-carboxytetrahydropterin synthase [bacterium]
MYELAVRGGFAAAHNLRDYKGKCEHIHGHNYIVEAVFECAGLQKNGLGVDFGILKESLNTVLEGLDHKYLNKDVEYFRKNNTSAENIAFYVFGSLEKRVKGAKLVKVGVWESENAKATYSRPCVAAPVTRKKRGRR